MLSDGPQLTIDDHTILIGHVIALEILVALKGIREKKGPGIVSYNSKFFKATLRIIKEDVKATIQDLFLNDSFYRAANCVEGYEAIACCTTLNKLIYYTYGNTSHQ